MVHEEAPTGAKPFSGHASQRSAPGAEKWSVGQLGQDDSSRDTAEAVPAEHATQAVATVSRKKPAPQEPVAQAAPE
jgi:hypothetical protein